MPVMTCIKLPLSTEGAVESQDAPVWHVHLEHGNQYAHFTNMD